MSARSELLADLVYRSGYELKEHDEASAVAALDAYRDEVLREASAKQRASSCCEFDDGCSGNCGGILADLIDPDAKGGGDG